MALVFKFSSILFIFKSALNSGVVLGGSGCSSDRLLLYQLTFQTHWSKMDFPKDYPKFRPPAQWSKVIGRTHDSHFHLFRLGSFASAGLKRFTETGNADLMDTFSQGRTGVCDAFAAPPILEGLGLTETQFFADGNHSKVSLLAKIIPSPDWFVGVDSLELCLGNHGEWVQSLTMDVDAIDAGTDNGYTFTAPKWPSLPQEAIYQITASHPSHPAASFFYPDKHRHRPIATFTFTKLKEYSLWPHPHKDTPPPADDPDPSDTETMDSEEQGLLPVIRPLRKRPRRFKGRGDCVVSPWTQWSDCTSKTCDLSEQYRTRSIVVHARSSGAPCPSLMEKKMCVPDKGCQSNLFDW